jgi:hypothetical protein
MTMANLALNKAPGERKGRQQPRSYQELCSISGTTGSRHATAINTQPDRDQPSGNQTPDLISLETLGQWAHTWFAWHSNRPDYWFPGDDQRVRDERPPMDASNYQIWLSRSEHDRTGHNSLTSDQLGRIYGGPDFEKVRVYHRRRRFYRGRV